MAGALSDRLDLGQQPDAAPNSSAAPALANSSTHCPIGLTSGNSRLPQGDAGQHGSTAGNSRTSRPTFCPIASVSDNNNSRPRTQQLGA